jgi:hypothetical protein
MILDTWYFIRCWCRAYLGSALIGMIAGALLSLIVQGIVYLTTELLGFNAWPLGLLFSVPVLVFLWSTWRYYEIVRDEALTQQEDVNRRVYQYYVIVDP